MPLQAWDTRLELGPTRLDHQRVALAEEHRQGGVSPERVMMESLQAGVLSPIPVKGKAPIRSLRNL